MDGARKLIIGYDLCDDYTQISCFSYKSMEPITISAREGEEQYKIPTVLCLKQETKQWLVGEEAITCAASGSGVLIENLMDKVLWDEVDYAGQKLSGADLLERYIRKTLMLVKNYFPTEQITKMVVTLRSAEPLIVEKIYEVLSVLGLEKDRAIILSHAGVYLYYALNQEKALWMNDVGMFEFSKDGLYFYKIHINRRVKPMIAGLEKVNYTEMLSMSMLQQKDMNAEYIFENVANTALSKQIITTLYLTGSGFEGSFARDVIKNLCIGRRVFLGQNLFTKGACYAAKELSGDLSLRDFILLNDDMIMSNIAVRVYKDAAFRDYELIHAGENWYELDKEIEVIPEGVAEIEIIWNNIMTREVSRKVIQFHGIPDRPYKMTRLLIHMVCKGKSSALLTITDLGFGDICPGTGQTEEFIIEL